MNKIEVYENENDFYFSQNDLTKSDIATGIAIGFIGSIITTSQKLKEFLHSVHDDASLKKPKTILGRILHHSGDEIDKVTRGGKSFATYLHRLYGGHDIFSLSYDNPFVVLCMQYGIPKGILQTIRHLVADTFSKNGGALPGSSFLDFIKEDGTVGNLIDEWSKEMASLVGLSSQEVYAELFAIKSQDVGSVAVINALITAYNAKKKSFTEIAVSQMKIISYQTAVFASVGIGAVKNKGVPKINYPVLIALFRETKRIVRLNQKEINELIKKNDGFEERLKKLEAV